jgi:hypothetical protein
LSQSNDARQRDDQADDAIATPPPTPEQLLLLVVGAGDLSIAEAQAI